MHEYTERANDRRHRRDTEKYEFCTRRRRRRAPRTYNIRRYAT